jgi:hypothetical protein
MPSSPPAVRNSTPSASLMIARIVRPWTPIFSTSLPFEIRFALTDVVGLQALDHPSSLSLGRDARARARRVELRRRGSVPVPAAADAAIVASSPSVCLSLRHSANSPSWALEALLCFLRTSLARITGTTRSGERERSVRATLSQYAMRRRAIST